MKSITAISGIALLLLGPHFFLACGARFASK
jgi:hypothetical protein